MNSKLKTMKKKLMEEHKKLFKRGELDAARNILHFIIYKKICLGISDADYETEEVLNKLKVKHSISTNCKHNTFYFK